MNFFRAIGAALRRVCGFVFDIGTWPLRLFGGGGGRPSVEPPRPPAKVPNLGARPAGQVVDHSLSQARDAKMLRAWVMSSLASGEHAFMPPSLPRSVKEWLPGLTAAQLEKLTACSNTQIADHIHGRKPVAGVPSVRALPTRPLEIERAPLVGDDDDFDAAIERVLFASAPGSR